MKELQRSREDKGQMGKVKGVSEEVKAMNIVPLFNKLNIKE